MPGYEAVPGRENLLGRPLRGSPLQTRMSLGCDRGGLVTVGEGLQSVL